MQSEALVLAAATARADALRRGDRSALMELLHPRFRWISHRGDILDRDTYIHSNTGGSLRWYGQQLTEIHVIVVDQTAILQCVVVDDVDPGSGRQSFRMPMTQTWIRGGSSWTCLAGHAGPRLHESV